MLLRDKLEFAKGNRTDFNKLKEYHYIKRSPCIHKYIFVIKPKFKFQYQIPNPVGVILYAYPIPNIKQRNIATRDFFLVPKKFSDRLRLVNKYVVYLSRWIVDPRFRKLGLGTWLLTESLNNIPDRIVETITPTDFTNKIFERFGFKLYHNEVPPWYTRILRSLDEAGIHENLFLHPKFAQMRIDALPEDRRQWILNEIKQFSWHFKTARYQPHGPDKLKWMFAKFPFPDVYAILRRKRRDPDRKV